MNSPALEKPAVNTPTDSAPLLVAVRVLIVNPRHEWYPPDNIVGSALLTHFLARKLMNEHLLEANVNADGYLNDSWHRFPVNSIGAALDCLHVSLADVILRPYSTILYWPAKEEYAAIHGPDHAGIGSKFTHAEIVAEFKRLSLFKLSPPNA